MYPACKICVSSRRKGYQSPNHKENDRKYRNSTRAELYKKNPQYYLWYIAKKRAEKQGHEFSIKPEDIIVHEFCPIIGSKLDVLTNNIETGMSLDRVDNRRGYIPGNVHAISRRGNLRKSDLSIQEVKNLLKYMEDNS